jgi:cytochrome c556
MRTIALLSITFATIAGSVQPTAADPLDDAIKARQSHMQLVSFNAGPLFSMAKGERDYDSDQAQTAANNLKALASMSTDAMWPSGTDNVAKKGKTRALPAIWEAGSDMGKDWTSWRTAVDDLAASAGDGLDSLKAKVAAMGKTCGACHKAHRAKDF